MNNATREDSCHSVQLPEDGSPSEPFQEIFPSGDDEAYSEVSSQLDKIRFAPRAATIRAIMKYAHEKDAAVH